MDFLFLLFSWSCNCFSTKDEPIRLASSGLIIFICNTISKIYVLSEDYLAKYYCILSFFSAILCGLCVLIFTGDLCQISQNILKTLDSRQQHSGMTLKNNLFITRNILGKCRFFSFLYKNVLYFLTLWSKNI